jgi:uncharacterized protein YjbK
MLMYLPENEKTFFIPANNVEKLLSLLQSKSGIISISNKRYKFINKKRCVSVHFIEHSEDINTRKRLKFIFSDGIIKVRYSPKKYGHEGAKMEGRSMKGMSLKKSLSMINGFGPVVGSILKDRKKFYYSAGKEIIYISIDKIVAFDASEISRYGSPIYHLEIESDKQFCVNELCNSEYFQEKIMPLIREVKPSETKWSNLSSFSQDKNYKFCFNTVFCADEYLRKIRMNIVGRNEQEPFVFTMLKNDGRDMYEHELKFQLDEHTKHEEILESNFSPFGEIVALKTDDISEENYIDTSDCCFAKNDASLRIRRTSNGKYNLFFKFPGTCDNGLFVRREIKSKVRSNKGCLYELMSNTAAGRHAIMFLENIGRDTDLQSINNIIYLQKKRSVYILQNSKHGKIGLIMFDAVSYSRIDSPNSKATINQLEFEVCSRNKHWEYMNLMFEARDKLLEFGLIPSTLDKYQQGLHDLHICCDGGRETHKEGKVM